MAPAGLAAIRRAKRDGSWAALDAVETLVEPDDLRLALDADPLARGHWEGFPPSARRAILSWIASAKTAPTRSTRVATTVTEAALGRRANQWRPPTSAGTSTQWAPTSAGDEGGCCAVSLGRRTARLAGLLAVAAGVVGGTAACGPPKDRLELGDQTNYAHCEYPSRRPHLGRHAHPPTEFALDDLVIVGDQPITVTKAELVRRADALTSPTSRSCRWATPSTTSSPSATHPPQQQAGLGPAADAPRPTDPLHPTAGMKKEYPGSAAQWQVVIGVLPTGVNDTADATRHQLHGRRPDPDLVGRHSVAIARTRPTATRPPAADRWGPAPGAAAGRSTPTSTCSDAGQRAELHQHHPLVLGAIAARWRDRGGGALRPGPGDPARRRVVPLGHAADQRRGEPAHRRPDGRAAGPGGPPAGPAVPRRRDPRRVHDLLDVRPRPARASSATATPAGRGVRRPSPWSPAWSPSGWACGSPPRCCPAGRPRAAT